MANTPTQHCVHPGRHTSHSPLRRVASARAASTIWISAPSAAGNRLEDISEAYRSGDSPCGARASPPANPARCHTRRAGSSPIEVSGVTESLPHFLIVWAGLREVAMRRRELSSEDKSMRRYSTLLAIAVCGLTVFLCLPSSAEKKSAYGIASFAKYVQIP